MLRYINMAMILAVMISALAVVHAKHKNRMLYVELREAHSQRDNLNVEWGRLQLEQSTLATHSRIESIARKKLNMRSLDYGEVVVVKK